MSWDAFLEVASATRMQGIELYDIGRDLFKGKASPTNPERAASVRRELISGKLSVPCINTVKDFTAPDFMKEFEACMTVAINLGISFVGIHTNAEDPELLRTCAKGLLSRMQNKSVVALVRPSARFPESFCR